MACALGLVLGLSRLADVEPRLAVLLAVGAAVCGNSAVVATAPVIGARGRDVAYAVAVVTLFGTCAVFAYPAIGHALGLSDASFGLWSGTAINDTSQVVAASAAYSPGALEVATVVKLIRNALMAPLLIGIAWAWARTAASADGAAGDTSAGIRKAVPAVRARASWRWPALRSIGVIGPDLAALLDTMAQVCILIALAAVGLSVRVGELRQTGPRALSVGFAAAIVDRCRHARGDRRVRPGGRPGRLAGSPVRPSAGLAGRSPPRGRRVAHRPRPPRSCRRRRS